MPPDDTVEIFSKLAVAIPAATAVILTCWMFLRAMSRRDDVFVLRMKESQMLGHQVANELAERYEKTLQSVATAHADALTNLAIKIDHMAVEVSAASKDIVRLCTLLEGRGVDR